MDQPIITAVGENEAKDVNSSATSHGKSSNERTRKGSEPITQEVRLRILQQAVIDYQHAGGQIAITNFYDAGKQHLAIIVIDALLGSDGNLIIKDQQ